MRKRILSIVGFAVLISLCLHSQGNAFAQDETITNAEELAAVIDQSGLWYPLVSPTEPSLSSYPLGIFWTDFSQLTNAIGDVRNFDGETQHGITVWRMRLTRTTNETVFSYPATETNLFQVAMSEGDFSNHYEIVLRTWCILEAARNFEPYDDLLADGFTFFSPKRLVLDITIADINDCGTYEDNVATANFTAGGFTAMDEEDPLLSGSDPCSITNLTQPFFVTAITRASNGATTITFPSCQIFRYLISYANSLSNNESWIPSAYVWGQTNVSMTSWTDLATTNNDGSTITQRFYRVERLLGSPIAAGAEQGAALTPDGKLWSWGRNDGNLGDGLDSAINVSGDYVEEYLPYPGDVTPITPCGGQTITNAVALAAGGDDFTLVVDADGAVWTFGENTKGQLGIGSVGDTNLYPVPMRISGVSNVVSMAAGYDHTLALTADMKVFAWGDDTEGKLGVGGSSGQTNTPVQSRIPTGTNIVAIAAGAYHSLALDVSGRVWAWGAGGSGQLGNGVTGDTNLPIQVPGISNVIAIAVGGYHTLALTADKNVWTWGDSFYGELGRTGSYTSPGQVSGLNNVVAIAGGNGFSVAVSSNGQVYAWGDNSYGQLGTNSSMVTSTNLPMLVAGISNAVWVSAPVAGDDSHSDYDDPGGAHVVAITVDQGTNHFWGWGDNNTGEVGNRVSGFSGGSFVQYTNQYSPAQLQFCTRCQRTVQLGTNGSFTAQCNGTLYLFSMMICWPSGTTQGRIRFRLTASALT